MDYQYIQLDYLEKMAVGDQDTRRKLLQMLISELESSGPRIKALWKSQNRTELQWLCHHLKSTFPFVGNERLANANRELEQCLRQGKDFNALRPLLIEIKNLIPKALKELRMELKKN